MNFKANKKYFEDKGILYTIGIILAIVGVVMMVFGMVTDFIPGGPYFFIPIAIVGIVVAVFAKGGILNDHEYDEQIRKRLGDLQQEAMNHFGLEEKHIRTLEPIIFNEYEFKEDPSYIFKKGSKDSKYRSNVYISAVLLFGNDKVYIYEKRFFTTDEQNPETTDTRIYSYNELSSAALIEETLKVQIKEKNITIKYYVFQLSTPEKILLSVASQDDIVVEKRIDNINKLIKKFTNN
jgi:hypothetical protein